MPLSIIITRLIHSDKTTPRGLLCVLDTFPYSPESVVWQVCVSETTSSRRFGSHVKFTALKTRANSTHKLFLFCYPYNFLRRTSRSDTLSPWISVVSHKYTFYWDVQLKWQGIYWIAIKLFLLGHFIYWATILCVYVVAFWTHHFLVIWRFRVTVWQKMVYIFKQIFTLIKQINKCP